MTDIFVILNIDTEENRLMVWTLRHSAVKKPTNMGLDMYLTQKINVGFGCKVTGVIELTIKGKKVPIDPTRVSCIVLDAGQWRKANAVHKWFVDNCQDGRDDCREVEVSYAQLLELRALCAKIIETKNPELLPPQCGFFFGSTDIDEYYFGELEETIDIIEALDADGHHYYQSSW
jgi:hypothetical protein